MPAAWAREETQDADLNDDRLNERLTAVLAALGERPTASIPAACGGDNEMMAADRFYNNDRGTFEKVLALHRTQTLRRIAEQPVVLLVQDTTEFDLTRPQQQVTGTGHPEGSSRRGTLLHPVFAFAPDGTPLGTCRATTWTREEPSSETRREKQKRRRSTPVAEKESRRWIDGLRQARAVADEVPEATCICIADSEADIDELFCEPQGEQPVQWLIRAGQDRSVQPAADDEPATRWRAAVEAQPPLFAKAITVRGRQSPIAGETRARRQPRENRRVRPALHAVSLSRLADVEGKGRTDEDVFRLRTAIGSGESAVLRPSRRSPSGGDVAPVEVPAVHAH